MIRSLARVACALALCLAAGTGLRADGVQQGCAATGGRVAAPSTDLAARICDAAGAALTRLQVCGLTLRHPVDIAVVDTLSAPHAVCIAQYDCHAERIALLDPLALAGAVSAGSAFSRVPVLTLLDSLVAHELTHAAISHATETHAIQTEAHEYIAYAMQIAALPPALRDGFLDHTGARLPTTLLELNGVILMLAPDRFAARAYLHFAAPEHGCGFVRRLLDGSAVFPRLPDP